jgi:hypothetical protein
MVRGWGGGGRGPTRARGGNATAFCVETLKDAMARHGKPDRTRDLPTDCPFAQDQTGVLAVFSLYYQRIDRGWPAVTGETGPASCCAG